MQSRDLSQLTDTELLNLVNGNDRDAFRYIYDRYWSKLYLSAYKILRDRQTSEDITQEILVQLWLKRHSQQIVSLNGYLYTAVRFQVFTAIRKGKVRADLYKEIAEICSYESADNNLMIADINRKLEEGLAALPERCREIFLLSRKEHLSAKQIAERLGISVKTVENQLTIAFKNCEIPWVKQWFGWQLYWHLFGKSDSSS